MRHHRMLNRAQFVVSQHCKEAASATPLTHVIGV
jgi:hypothetical protein